MQGREESADEKRKKKYGKCSFFHDGKCGPHTKSRTPIDEMFSTEELKGTAKPHLLSLKLIRSNDAVAEWTERRLIENRIGRPLREEEVLCAYHRYVHGMHWKQPRTCQHPDHVTEKGKKATPGRVATIARSLELCIPVGSMICRKHRCDNSSSTEIDSLQTDTNVDMDQTFIEDTSDVDFVSPEVNRSEEALQRSFEIGESMTSSLERTPIRYKLETRVENIQSSTLKKLHDQMKKWEDSTRKQFAASVAPGQEEDLLKAFEMIEYGDAAPQPSIPDDVKQIISVQRVMRSPVELFYLYLTTKSPLSKK